MIESQARTFMDQANASLQSHITLESAWTAVTLIKRVLEIGKEMKYSRAGIYHCAETKIRMEQRLGAIIELIEDGHPEAASYGPVTVKSLNIPKRQVSVCKELLDIPEEDLQRYFERIEKEKRSLTAATVLRQREDDPVRGILDSIQLMADLGDDEGVAKANRELRELFATPEPQPAPEPMPRTPDDKDAHRMRGLGIKWD